jgi:hypothetical protein
MLPDAYAVYVYTHMVCMYVRCGRWKAVGAPYVECGGPYVHRMWSMQTVQFYCPAPSSFTVVSEEDADKMDMVEIRLHVMLVIDRFLPPVLSLWHSIPRCFHSWLFCKGI